MDFNGDGYSDLVVSCPDVPFNGTYVFENPGVHTASNPLPVFSAGFRIGPGRHFASVSFINGKTRVLTPASEFPDFKRSGLEKPVSIYPKSNVHPNPVRGNFWRLADYNGDGNTDLLVGADDWTDYGWDNAYDPQGRWTRGPLRGFVYWIPNIGSDAKPEYGQPQRLLAGSTPIETFGWPSPCLADFRGTGKLDLICGEFLDGFTFFENKGSRTQPRYAEGRRLQSPNGQAVTLDLEMITPTAFDWDQDGKPDLIVGDEDGRVALVRNLGTLGRDGSPLFDQPRYFRQDAAELKCGALATPVGFDWDGDGSIDLVSGNSAGYLVFYKNLSAKGVEKPRWDAPRYLEADGQRFRIQAGPNGSIQGPAEAKWGYTTLSIADWDHDGLPDLLVNSILGKVVWHKNIGSRSHPKLAAAQPIEVEWSGPQPQLDYGWMKPEGKALLTQWRTTPFAVDWNHDGLTDLVMLDHQGVLSLFRRERRQGALILLPPEHVFVDSNGQPLRLSKGSAGKSGRRKFCIVDWDGDGKLDILLNSTNATLLRQVDHRDGKWLFEDKGPISPANIEGHDVSPTTVDFNNDGIPDFIGGAEDGHFYYLKNPRTP
jgi:hypothetical protein